MITDTGPALVRPFPDIHWTPLALSVAALWMTAAHAASAQTVPLPMNIKTMRAVRAVGPVTMDGVLDEEAWRAAEPISDLVQQEPHVDQPVSERTEIRVVLDDEALYFGVTCHDARPGGVTARELRRDNPLTDDDRFEIVLDTFHDHRNGYHFVVNPLGTQYDALITDEGQDVNVEWDERWWSVTEVSDEGWSAEIKIPYTTLRSPQNVDTFGVNFKRFIRRKNEIAQWTAWDRDFNFLQVSQAGHLAGLEGVRTGLKLRIKPYVLGGIDRVVQGDQTDIRGLGDVGLEVMKFSVTPGVTAELTANTDFAQTEVDEAVVNLTRFPLFFPEKREFFLERSGIFQFGLGGRRGAPEPVEPNLQMYFSRQIGLTDDGRPVPVIAGGKMTGHAGGLDLGVLNVQTDQFEGTPGSNYTVLRAKRNVLARSNVGVFASNRQSSASDYNRVFGADANFTLFKNTDIQGFIGKSWTPGVTGDDYAGRAKFNWFSDLYEVFVEHLYVGPEFQHDLGFVQRRGIRRTDAAFIWEPRPDVLDLRNLVFRSQVIYLTDINGSILGRDQMLQTTARWQSDDVVRFNLTQTFDRVEESFEIAPDISIPPGDYSFLDAWIEYEGSPGRIAAGRIRYGQSNFYGGRRHYVRLSPTYKPLPQLSLETSYEFNDIALPQGAFTTHVMNARVNVNLNTRWLTTTLAQYDTASKRQTLFFRLNYIYRAGDDVFVVFNRTDDRAATGRPPEFTVMVKFTHSIDF